jgi:hypothetical protein
MPSKELLFSSRNKLVEISAAKVQKKVESEK